MCSCGKPKPFFAYKASAIPSKEMVIGSSVRELVGNTEYIDEQWLGEAEGRCV